MTAQYTITIRQLIENNIKIFDFDYPIYNENFRPVFEQIFIDHFYLEEIAHETFTMFKLRLKSKLNLIMPKYNKIYESQELEQRILDNYDVTETIKRTLSSDSTSESSNNSKGDVRQLYKDAPKTRIDINNFDVVTNLTKNTTLNEVTGSEKVEGLTNEEYERKMTGNIGIQTDADAIIKYWDSLRNVTLEIFENELIELFMGVF